MMNPGSPLKKRKANAGAPDSPRTDPLPEPSQSSSVHALCNCQCHLPMLEGIKNGAINAEEELEILKELLEEFKEQLNDLSSVTEERDQLRNVINELKKHKNVETGGETENATLIQELGASIAKKECSIKELDSTLCEQKKLNICQKNVIKLLSERRYKELRRMKSLEKVCDQLQCEITILKSKLGDGDFCSTKMKVPLMVDTLRINNETKQTIEALQTELQETMDKLQAVEELKRQTDSYASQKILELQVQLARLQSSEEKWKMLFQDILLAFKQACRAVFGYKLVLYEYHRRNGIPMTRFTLQSIYAQGNDEKLEFEYESGYLNILENDYTSRPEISNQIKLFIRRHNSTPAFTANLTVESFKRQSLP